MASHDLSVHLGPIPLRSPLVAASGTVGWVWEWAQVADVAPYGAAVAKSVSPQPWPGLRPPRMATLETGMLNGIGIQNPGVGAFASEMKGRIGELGVPVWGSAVAEDPEGFALVASALEGAGVSAVEVNLSCPNLKSGRMFSLDAGPSAAVVAEVRAAVTLPVGAKLSPNTDRLVEVASACVDAGADFLVLTNTAVGFAMDVESRAPRLSGGAGGYSGPGLRPLAMACVHAVASALPGVPIVGCGGVHNGRDVAEYLMAGAAAVALGTVHLAEPKAGRRILGELNAVMARLGVAAPKELMPR